MKCVIFGEILVNLNYLSLLSVKFTISIIMIKTHRFLKLFFIFTAIFLPSKSRAQLMPQDVITEIQRSINMGNTLEPPLEGFWNNGPAEEYYFDLYKEASFTCVRIPVRWDKHTLNNSPYTIKDSWLDRVEEVLDWGLNRDLFVIVNLHHEKALVEDYENQKDRYDSIWCQIARRFKDKSDKLLFEIINEPKGLSQSQIDEFNKRELQSIRITNPTRIVLYSGNEWANSNDLLNAAIPDTNDAYLMAYYHSYDPWNFAGEGNGTWGTEAEIQAMSDKMTEVKSWSYEHEIPVIIDEFGAQKKCDYNSRMYYYAKYVELAIGHGLAFAAWDDGGDFGILQREDSVWNDIKDILIYTSDSSATQLGIEMIGDTAVKINWQSRSSFKSKTIIEKKSVNGVFVNIAEMDSLQTNEFIDYELQTGEYLYYRIVEIINGQRFPSYPIRILNIAMQSQPFLGNPLDIPGELEAEYYDIGGEQNTYHDSETENLGGAFRLTEAVDIEERPGGYQVAFVEAGEWMDYSIDVKSSGKYTIKAYLASQDGGGKMQLAFENTNSDIIQVPKTGDWTSLAVAMTNIDLLAGEQKMRINIVSKPAFNIDKIEIVKYNYIAEEEQINFFVYPNPATNRLKIKLENGKIDSLSIINLKGQKLLSEIVNSKTNTVDINSLAPGIYWLIVKTTKGEFKKTFVKK